MNGAAAVYTKAVTVIALYCRQSLALYNSHTAITDNTAIAAGSKGVLAKQRIKIAITTPISPEIILIVKDYTPPKRLDLPAYSWSALFNSSGRKSGQSTSEK